MADLQKALQTLKTLNDFANMYEGDFFLTWEKTDDEIRATFEVAEALRALREKQRVSQDFRQRPCHLDVPRQLHPHPLQLRLRGATCWA